MDPATTVYHVARSGGYSGTVGSEIVKFLRARDASPNMNVLILTSTAGWKSLYNYNLEDPIALFGPQVFLGGVPFKEDDDRLPAWEKLIAFLRPRASNPFILGLLSKTERLLLDVEEDVVGEIFVEELEVDVPIPRRQIVESVVVEDDFPIAYSTRLASRVSAIPAMPTVADVEKSAYEMGHRRGRSGASSPGMRRTRPSLTPLPAERVVVRETFTDPL